MSERGGAAIMMIALVMIWGYAWVLAKIALTYCAPLDLATMRTALAVLILLPVLLWSRKPLKPEHPRHALVVGVIQTAGFLLLNNFALSMGQPGKTAVLTFTMPFWVLLLGWPVLKERIDAPGWIGLGLAAIGLTLLLEPWRMHSALLPSVLAVLAGFCWALGVVIAKKLHNREPVDAFNFTFWQMLFGVLPMLALAATTRSRPIQWTPEFIVVLLILSSIATAAGWMMWLYVLHRLPAGTTSMSSLGVPVIALVSSALQLGERPQTAELAGMGLIATALAIVSWDTVRQHREIDPQMGQE
jgi:drug/metabolite transporter (DMT)-like permease